MSNYLFFMHDCDIFVQNISFYLLLVLLDNMLNRLILLFITVLSERKQVLNSLHCFRINILMSIYVNIKRHLKLRIFLWSS